MSGRSSPQRSPSPDEPELRGSPSSSLSRAHSQFSSARSSRMQQRRRTSAEISTTQEEEQRQSDRIWAKAQQEWEGLKRVALKRQEQDAWKQLLSGERQERLAINPEMTSRRQSTSKDRASTMPTTASDSQHDETLPLIPVFVSARTDVPRRSGEPDEVPRHWRYWFRGIYTDATVDSSRHQDAVPLESSCCFCCTRRTKQAAAHE